MSAYHQLGHHSESMVLEDELHAFGGIILSPVNYTPENTASQCNRFRRKSQSFDIVFDPQIYKPRSDRGVLKEWTYFPKDLETSDFSSAVWWGGMVDSIVKAAQAFNPNGICSPIIHPKVFDDEFYELTVFTGNTLHASLPRNIRSLLTAIVSIVDLTRNNRYLQISSILSKFRGQDIYLLLSDEEPPRRERTESGGLEGAARLISVLEAAGYRITVGYTSTEMLMWKAAGAANVATGKFFNLRRFTLNRWEEPSKGGKNIPYWHEPELTAFIREADVRRFKREFKISSLHDENPYSQHILTKLNAMESQEAWLADSWRQYLYWFAKQENLLSADRGVATKVLENSNQVWESVRNSKLRFEEQANDGSWINAWLIVLNELERRAD